MDSHDYYRILTIQNIWREAMADARKMASDAAQQRAAAQKG